jgi:regulator of replication initiation timing
VWKAGEVEKELGVQKRVWEGKEDEHRLAIANLEKKIELVKEANGRLKKDVARLTTHVSELTTENASLTATLSEEQSKASGTFESGKVVGIGEGRSIERSEIQAEIGRLEELVQEYRSRATAIESTDAELTALRTENAQLAHQLSENTAYT